VLRRLVEEPAGGAEAGVREDDVDPAEPVDGGGRQGLDLIPLGHVAGDGQGIAGTELLRERVERLLAPCRQDDPVATCDRATRRGRADPG